MSQIRADLWCAAYVRRHNDLGRMCVVARKGDAIAGQIWVELDHLDGTVSLYGPAPVQIDRPETSDDRLFQKRLDRVEPARVRERMLREEDFDPDFWLISLDLRGEEHGLQLVG